MLLGEKIGNWRCSTMMRPHGWIADALSGKFTGKFFDSILISSGFACSAGKKKIRGFFSRFETPIRLSAEECKRFKCFPANCCSKYSLESSMIAQFNLQKLLGKYEWKWKASISIDVKPDSHRPKTVAENVIWNFHFIRFRSCHKMNWTENRLSLVYWFDGSSISAPSSCDYVKRASLNLLRANNKTSLLPMQIMPLKSYEHKVVTTSHVAHE